MAGKVGQRSSDEQLAAMATEIVLVQRQQIGHMLAWLDIWGIGSLGGSSYMAWMGHGLTDWRQLSGIAMAEEINRLDTLPVPEAEVLFDQLIIRHHRGGVEMAEAGLESAETDQVRTLAVAIAQTQQYELNRMQDLLRARGLPPVPDDTPITDRCGSSAPTSVPAPANRARVRLVRRTVAQWPAARASHVWRGRHHTRHVGCHARRQRPAVGNARSHSGHGRRCACSPLFS